MILIGFYHEITRLDRNNYVDIDFEAIKQNAEAFLKIWFFSNLGDFWSVLLTYNFLALNHAMMASPLY